MACDREDSQDVSRPLCNAFTYPDRKSTGKKKGRLTTLGWRARKDCSLQTNALNLQVHSLLLMIPEMWLVIIRVNRGSENFFYNYCSNIFSFVSSCWHFSCFSSPHLWHYSRRSASQYPLSWTADLHQEIWVCTIAYMWEKNLSIQWKSVMFFHGNKYENIFPISAAWQSHKLTHITICVTSSSMPTHCGQKLLHMLTGRNSTELYWL